MGTSGWIHTKLKSQTSVLFWVSYFSTHDCFPGSKKSDRLGSWLETYAHPSEETAQLLFVVSRFTTWIKSKHPLAQRWPNFFLKD